LGHVPLPLSGINELRIAQGGGTQNKLNRTGRKSRATLVFSVDLQPKHCSFSPDLLSPPLLLALLDANRVRPAGRREENSKEKKRGWKTPPLGLKVGTWANDLRQAILLLPFSFLSSLRTLDCSFSQNYVPSFPILCVSPFLFFLCSPFFYSNLGNKLVFLTNEEKTFSFKGVVWGFPTSVFPLFYNSSLCMLGY